MKTLPLNLIHRFSFFVFLLLFATAVYSQAGRLTEAQEKVNLRYIGCQDDHLVFYLQVTNGSREPMRFMLRDENRNILFEENFSTGSFEKKILLEKFGLENVSFEIIGKNYNCRKEFSIRTRTIEEVTVSEKTK